MKKLEEQPIAALMSSACDELARLQDSNRALLEQRDKLVEALTDCAESLRHSIEDMKSAGETGWRVQMREERLAEAERVLREVDA